MSKPNYQQAFEELQQIVTELENGQVTVDELSEKVNRASVLITICKTKLTTTEDNVKKILAAIEKPEADAEAGDPQHSADEEGVEKTGDAPDLPF